MSNQMYILFIIGIVFIAIIFLNLKDKPKTIEAMEKMIYEAELFYSSHEHIESPEKYQLTIKMYDEIIGYFKDSEDQGILEHLASLYFRKGIVISTSIEPNLWLHDESAITLPEEEVEKLRKLEIASYQKSIELYYKIKSEFDAINNEAITADVTTAIYNRGNVLSLLEDFDESILDFNKVIEEFSGSKDEEISENIVRSFLGKATALDNLGKHEEMLLIYNTLFENFNRDEYPKTPEVERIVAGAHYNLAYYFKEKKEYKEALSIYNNLIEQFINSNDNPTLDVIRLTLTRKSEIFIIEGETKKSEEALIMRDEIIEKLKNRDYFI